MPRIPRAVSLALLGLVAVAVLILAVVFNSGLFAATDIWVKGSEHVSKEAAEQLIDLPEGTTLFSVDEGAIAERLMQNPWVSGVDVERVYPHTLVITPRERAVSAIVYIASDDIAWAVGDDDCWIAPVSLAVEAVADADPAVDGGESADAPADDSGADSQQAAEAQRQSSLDAALAVANELGALLMTDVASGVSPASGKPVESDVVLAGLKYAKALSPEFKAQIKFMSVPSEEAISVNLVSGVEVALGAPDDIKMKERVVTKLLEQEAGVTYVDVRVPNAYTFRSAPL